MNIPNILGNTTNTDSVFTVMYIGDSNRYFKKIQNLVYVKFNFTMQILNL